MYSLCILSHRDLHKIRDTALVIIKMTAIIDIDLVNN